MSNLIPEPQRINNNDKGWLVRTVLNALHVLFGDAINQLSKEKVDKTQLSNMSVGIKDYKENVTEIADLPTTENIQGDARVVVNDKDNNERSYIWLWNGTSWSRTAFTSLPGDVLTQAELTNQITEETNTTPANKAIADALSLKSSINYFFGRPAIDFENKEINFPEGWFTYGKSDFKLSAQTLSYTSENSLRIYLNLINKQWVLQPITESISLPNHIYVGVVDIGNSNVTGNFREADLGNRQKMGRQGYIQGSDFRMSINFNAPKDGWSFKTTLGYLTTENGNDIISIPAQSLDFTDNNIRYVYVDPVEKEFVIYSYYKKPSRSFQNLYFIGTINPTDKNVLLNVTGLVIDGKEIKQFTKEQSEQLTDSVNQLGQSKQSFLPATGWISKPWNTYLDTGAIFVDIRCIISDINKLKNIMLVSSTAGSINLYLLDMNFNVIKTIEKNVIQWFNNTTIDNIDYTQPMYVGFENITGKVQTISPPDNTGNGRKINKTTGAVTVSNYSYAFVLETIDYRETLFGQVRVLGDRFMPTSDDINTLLSQYDVVQLQPRDYLIKKPIVMQSGKVLQGSFGKTRLILSEGNNKIISGTGLTDIKISDMEQIGTQANYTYSMNGIDSGANIIASEEEAENLTYMGDEIGIHLTSCEKVVLENLKIRNLTGSGMRMNRVGRDYIWGMKVNNLFISNCYNGVLGENEHEFSNYNNFIISLCQVGTTFSSGNLLFNNGIITRCRVGTMLKNGYNHAHGIMSSMEIKHNQIAGVFCKDIEHGQSFQGLYVSYCNVILRNSRGLYFNNLKMGNGSIICSNEANMTGKNVIDSLVRRTNSVTVNNTGNLEIKNTIDLF